MSVRRSHSNGVGDSIDTDMSGHTLPQYSRHGEYAGSKASQLLAPPTNCAYRHKWLLLGIFALAFYFHIHVFIGFGLRQAFSYLIPYPKGIKVCHFVTLNDTSLTLPFAFSISFSCI